MSKKNWKIRGYDGLNQTFEETSPADFSDIKIIGRLRLLAACHLEPEEV